MKIALDAGALTNKNSPFGTYTFTKELIAALKKYDRQNNYIYFYLSRFNKYFGWLKFAIPWQNFINRTDWFLALNQALPRFGTAKTIAFSHGLSFKYYPKLYPDSYQKMDQEIKQMLKKANWIIVSSKKVKKDFKKFYQQNQKIIVLPFGLSEVFKKTSYKYKRKKIILFVGLFHPIKNLDLIVKSFTLLKKEAEFTNYKLVLIGNNQEFPLPIISKEIKKDILILPPQSQENLLRYYCEASCLVSASFYESFNFPILEALSQNTPVIATSSAVIPELKPFVTVSKNNSLDLKNKIIGVLTSNPKKRSFCKTQDRQFNNLSLFTWQNFVKKLTDLYER